MRLVEYCPDNRLQLGVVRDDIVFNVRSIEPGLPDRMLPFIQQGEQACKDLERALSRATPARAAGRFGEVSLAAPLPNPPKLMCVAANYREHIVECGLEAPETQQKVTPQFFCKFPSTCITGPGAPITLTSRNVAPDWELELAVVIGRAGRNIPIRSALDHVFGYTIINDISERKLNSNLANRIMRPNDSFFDWLNGKWFDGFAPLGPVIVTADEVPDPQFLKIRLELNGEVMQDSNTAKMISPVAELIAYISEYVSLEPGDIIATGTPEGVGISRGRFLCPGDVLTGWIEGLGCLETRVVAEAGAARG
jgi:2-keto-4-pentenoate hydratase/2-oxohepta-3-ene-1,7-dioic acid hydratase in catechol pathway